MGGIAKLISFARVMLGGANISDVQADRGGGDTVTAQHFCSPGDDSQPLPGDYVLLVTVPGSGRQAVAGYIDAELTPVANPGEKRIYSRDGNGDSIAVAHLQSDGTIELSNGSGSVMLQSNGDVIINGVTISANGFITAPSSIVLGGFELAGHIHAQGNDSNGDTQQPTGPNL